MSDNLGPPRIHIKAQDGEAFRRYVAQIDRDEMRALLKPVRCPCGDAGCSGLDEHRPYLRQTGAWHREDRSMFWRIAAWTSSGIAIWTCVLFALWWIFFR